MRWFRRVFNRLTGHKLDYTDLIDEPEPKWKIDYRPGCQNSPGEVCVKGRIGKHELGIVIKVESINDLDVDKRIEKIKERTTETLRSLYRHDDKDYDKDKR